MSKGAFKANTVDRYLRPIREQVKQLITRGATVVEFGFGNGDLLFKLSDSISKGKGIDISNELITFANNRKQQIQASNLFFETADISSIESIDEAYDYGVASLLLHVLNPDDAIRVLQILHSSSKEVIICGFSQPENWNQRLMLWLDQRFSGHYQHFRHTKRMGI